MPKCLKCNEDFTVRAVVDGVVKRLNRKQHCLKCEPFGNKNVRQENIKNRAKVDKSHKWLKRIRKERKQQLVEIAGGKCSICRYSRCLRAMHFHHIEPDAKKFALSQMVMGVKSWLEILREASKTVLLCSNCHSEVEDGMHDDKIADWKNKLSDISQIYFAYIERAKEFPVQGKRIRDKDNPGRRKIQCQCHYCKTVFESTYNQKYCSTKCCGEMNRKVERPSKDQLIELLKGNSWYGLGKKYGVCDNTVRKWAKRYNIL